MFSANSIDIKIGTGLGVAVLGWVLGACGYDETLAVQPESALTAIRVIFIYVPVITYSILAFVITRYKLDSEYDQIVAELESRKRGQA